MAYENRRVENVVELHSVTMAYAKLGVVNVVEVNYAITANKKLSVLSVVEVKSAITANAKRIANLAEVAASANRHRVKHRPRINNTKASVNVVSWRIFLTAQSHGIT